MKPAFLWLTFSALLLVAMVLEAKPASASLVLDLRFDPSNVGYTDPKLNIALPGTYTIDIWAVIHGNDTTGTNESLHNEYSGLQSLQVGGGAVAVGGITSLAAHDSNFWSTNSATAGGSPGTSQNITPDGIGDWGGTGPNGNTGAVAIILADAQGATHSNFEFSTDANGHPMPASDFNILGAGSAGAGVEFWIGSFTFTLATPTFIGGSETVIQVTHGNSIALHNNKIDNTTVESSSATYLAETSANYVTFEFMPEPNTFVLLGLGGLGLGALRFRRKQRNN